jgi:hypothetical protein
LERREMLVNFVIVNMKNLNNIEMGVKEIGHGLD